LKRVGRALALLIGLTVLTVCATASRGDWSKDGVGPDDLARDRYACIQQSRVPYPTSYGASVASGGTSGGFVFLGAGRRAQSEATLWANNVDHHASRDVPLYDCR
jgi:hypothetical protein